MVAPHVHTTRSVSRRNCDLLPAENVEMVFANQSLDAMTMTAVRLLQKLAYQNCSNSPNDRGRHTTTRAASAEQCALLEVDMLFVG